MKEKSVNAEQKLQEEDSTQITVLNTCLHLRIEHLDIHHDRCLECGKVSNNEYSYHKKSGDLRQFTRIWPV